MPRGNGNDQRSQSNHSGLLFGPRKFGRGLKRKVDYLSEIEILDILSAVNNNCDLALGLEGIANSEQSGVRNQLIKVCADSIPAAPNLNWYKMLDYLEATSPNIIIPDDIKTSIQHRLGEYEASVYFETPEEKFILHCDNEMNDILMKQIVQASPIEVLSYATDYRDPRLERVRSETYKTLAWHGCECELDILTNPTMFKRVTDDIKNNLEGTKELKDYFLFECSESGFNKLWGQKIEGPLLKRRAGDLLYSLRPAYFEEACNKITQYNKKNISAN